MGKKICFLGVLAVTLLILPIHAQTVAKRMKATAERFVVDKPLEQEQLKAAKVKAKGKTLKFEEVKSPLKTSEAAGEVVDEHGIITSPAEGVEKTYIRSGGCYISESQQVVVKQQSGSLTLVECSDGTVYIKDIIAYNPCETWVKGSKVGNTITIPAKQPIFYSTNKSVTTSIRWGIKDASGNYVVDDEHADAFVFTVNGDAIVQEGTSENLFLGQFLTLWYL